MEEKKVRQLAAIMFTDIVGYTALMQGDEKVAVTAREKHRKVFKEQHQIHQGEIVQYYGDGALSVFKSAIEATQCAMAIQKQLQQGEPVPLKVGIHLGDIVFNNTEVYGDGVNLASRIESMAVAGSILLSGKLNDELKNHKDITTRSLGHYSLKNITEPVEVFAVTNEGITVPEPSALQGKQIPKSKTIAVLPFVNMSASEDNEYFSDGITEEIINALSKIKTLKVTSRTSSFFFKNKNISMRQIGKELNVAVLLEGSVRLAGDRVRITAQLIEAENDFHFWSETWDRKLENIFEIQDEVSLHIADRLREQFGHFEIQDHLVEKQTESLDAYSCFLKGKFHFNKWNPEDAKKAISYFEKAIALDPKHADSYVRMADCYSFLATTGFMSYEEGWSKATQLTEQAMELNDQLPGVYYQQANLSFFIGCDYKTAFIQMAKAVELNPNFAEAQQFMSFLYVIAGQKEKSQHHLDIALSINPLSQETLFFQGYHNYMQENVEVALEQLNQCITTNPKNIPANATKPLCLLKLGRYDEVIEFLNSIPKDVVVPDDHLGFMALAYAMKKEEPNASKYTQLLIERANTPEGLSANSYLFLLYGVLGQHDKAFEWIDNAINNKYSLVLLRFADPLVNPIKDDPRYTEAQKKLFQSNLEDEPKKKKELLSKKETDDYTDRLLNHIKEHQPFLNPELSLRSLAAQIDIHPNQLSWLLNENMGKNFNEFINHYRVEAFKALSKDPKKANLTLIGMAYECGFNSKTVFNTYFKRETGLTPKQFLKEQE
ncbi:MAG: helix-turn-helix domain-containing protein [Cyclobacteriaceae bacterium]|nr:helix-turn-helix domain-containing protein [Cyclobacteriaceae bacterium]